mgnify:CR=1 FL=1
MSIDIKLKHLPTSGGEFDVATIATNVDNSGNIVWEMPDALSDSNGNITLPANFRADILRDGVVVHTGSTFVINSQTSTSLINNYGSTQDIRLYNHGNVLRIARGHGAGPQVYQYIDRDFFWDNNEGAYQDFNLDDAVPNSLALTNYIADNVQNSGWFRGDFGFTNSNFNWASAFHEGTVDENLALQNVKFFYRASFVYDGVQESPLDTFLGDTLDFGHVPSSASDHQETVPSISIQLLNGGTSGIINERITGINIYRSVAYSGPYYKIGSVSTLSTDPNRIHISSGALPPTYTDNTYVYLKDTNSSYAGKLLSFHGFRLTFSNTQANSANGIHKLATTNAIGGTAYSNDDTLHTGNAEKDCRMWDAPYIIVESNLHTDNDNGRFESGDFANWTLSATGTQTSLTNTTDRSLLGTQSLRMANSSQVSAQRFANTPFYTVTAGTEYVFECFISTSDGSFAPQDLIVRLYSAIDGTATTSELDYQVSSITQNTLGTFEFTNSRKGWERIKLKGTIPSGHNRAYARFELGQSDIAYVDNITFGQLLKDSSDGGYAGRDVVIFPEKLLGTKDSHKGWIFQHGTSGTNTRRGWIWQNTDRAIQFYRSSFYSSTSTTFPYNESTVGGQLTLNENYMWRDDGTNKVLNFYDKKLPDGAEHPYFDTNINVNYKYCTISDGRLFAANVKIDPSGAAEVHNNWIIFSELNQYDVLPITNYIQLDDRQGGEITGIETLLGDVVVFMERGVYRLNIPSAFPSDWSLVESEENIGCNAPDSIVKSEGNLFFASQDHIYMLDGNFNAIPITEPIKDEYQLLAGPETVLHIDPKKNRLLCKVGTNVKTIFVYCIRDNGWSKINTGSESSHLFALDENLVSYTIEHETQLNQGQNDTSLNSLDPATPVEATDFTYETGWIPVSDMEYNKILRSLDIRYSCAGGVTAYIYTDDDNSTVKWQKPLSRSKKFDTLRIGLRAKNFKLKLLGEQDYNSVEIGRIEVDIDE